MPITSDWTPNADAAPPAAAEGTRGDGTARTLAEAALWLGLAQVARQAAAVIRQHAPRSPLWIGLRRAALLAANLIEESLTEEAAPPT